MELKIITKEFKKDIEYNKYFNNSMVCFIDIETTGLSRAYSSIYLIGVLYYAKVRDIWTLTQYFAENIEQEGAILFEFIRFISDYDKIITYNGDSFDIPFINQRLDKLNIQYNISKDNSVDLYRLVKNNKLYMNLDNLKLKTLEKYLGIEREDIYTGKDCIQFFLDYVKTNHYDLMYRILQHNYDDLFYMPDIMKIINIIETKKSLLIDYMNTNLQLYIEDIKVIGDHLVVNGFVKGNNSINLIHYHSNYKIYFDNENRFEVTIEYSIGLVSPTTKGLFVDKNKMELSKDVVDKTIYYLPSHILLLKVEKQYCIENIKLLLTELITKSI